jgi:hypothetical protein
MRVRLLSVVLLALCGWVLAGFTQPALANPVVTVTTTGVVAAGNDDGSLTGTAGSLAGQSVTMVQTFVVTPAYSETGTNPVSGAFASGSVAVTIGAFATVTFAEPPFFAAITVGTLDTVNALPSQFSTFFGTLDGSGNIFEANAMIQSLVDALVASTNIFEDHDFIPGPSSASSSFGATLNTANFDPIWDFFVEGASAFTVVVTGLPTAVPAPAALGLFGLGLAGLAIARRAGRPRA